MKCQHWITVFQLQNKLCEFTACTQKGYFYQKPVLYAGFNNFCLRLLWCIELITFKARNQEELIEPNRTHHHYSQIIFLFCTYLSFSECLVVQQSCWVPLYQKGNLHALPSFKKYKISYQVSLITGLNFILDQSIIMWNLPITV